MNATPQTILWGLLELFTLLPAPVAASALTVDLPSPPKMSFSAASAGYYAAGDASPGAVVPAQLGFLAIYNPSLGTSDETMDDQIVYYASGPPSSSGHGANAGQRRLYQPLPSSSPTPPSPFSSSPSSFPAAHPDQDERNERLRQIGLAQGMVAFGKSFSGDQPVDTIETDKTRVVLHELEPGWWLLVVCSRPSGRFSPLVFYISVLFSRFSLSC